jgi:hypothetical protein
MVVEPGLQVARQREEAEVEAPVGPDHHHPPVLNAGMELVGSRERLGGQAVLEARVGAPCTSRTTTGSSREPVSLPTRQSTPSRRWLPA